MSQIVIKPIITEKMTDMTEVENRYGFLVKYDANKIEIKNAIEKLYGVTVEKVRTMRNIGKQKSRFTKTGVISGRSAATKKAIIAIADGETIDLYSNI